VNNNAVNQRTPLNHNDRIRICDFLAAFLDPPPASAEAEADVDVDDGEGSTVEAIVNQSSVQLLEQQPAEKLRYLLEISTNLNTTLDLDQLLPKIVENLFQLFRQADRCFIIQTEEGTNRLLPRVVRTRRPSDQPNAGFSRRIVNMCLQNGQALLSDDASRDSRIELSQSVVDFRIRSVMCVPLTTADSKSLGVIQLDTQDRSK